MKIEKMFKKYMCKMGYGPMIDYDEDKSNIFNPDARLIAVRRSHVQIVFEFEDGTAYPILDESLNRQPVSMCMSKAEVFDMIVEYLVK